AFADPRRAAALDFDVQRYDPMTAGAGWGALAQVYAMYNARRPLTVVRDERYWHTFAAPRICYRIEDERLRILVATPPANPRDVCGYVLAQFFDVGVLVSELAVRGDMLAAIPALLEAVRGEAAERGLKYGEVDLPHEAAVDEAVAELFGSTLHLSDPNPNIMARRISPIFGEDYLDAIFAAPGAIYWGIDHF